MLKFDSAVTKLIANMSVHVDIVVKQEPVFDFDSEIEEPQTISNSPAINNFTFTDDSPYHRNTNSFNIIGFPDDDDPNPFGNIHVEQTQHQQQQEQQQIHSENVNDQKYFLFEQTLKTEPIAPDGIVVETENQYETPAPGQIIDSSSDLNLDPFASLKVKLEEFTNDSDDGVKSNNSSPSTITTFLHAVKVDPGANKPLTSTLTLRPKRPRKPVKLSVQKPTTTTTSSKSQSKNQKRIKKKKGKQNIGCSEDDYSKVNPRSKCECPLCPKKFPCNSALQSHVETHKTKAEQVRPFVCEICGQSFRIQYNLTNHLKIHSDERPFKCPQTNCNQTFKIKSVLRNHLKVKHSDSRPFQCPLPCCAKTFKDKKYLASHLQVFHSQERPHKCKESNCDAEFATPGQLNYHVKAKHSEANEALPRFPCEACNKVFTLKWQLKRHALAHTDDRPFKCTQEGCKSAYKRKHKLMEHQKRDHKYNLN